MTRSSLRNKCSVWRTRSLYLGATLPNIRVHRSSTVSPVSADALSRSTMVSCMAKREGAAREYLDMACASDVAVCHESPYRVIVVTRLRRGALLQASQRRLRSHGYLPIPGRRCSRTPDGLLMFRVEKNGVEVDVAIGFVGGKWIVRS